MNRPNNAQVRSLDLAGLERVAESMLRQLRGPLVIGLVGTLGAGKTTLVQKIARACGVDSADVTSPTFTLVQTHRGSRILHHADAYRISDEDEFLQLGVEELFDDADAWTMIEWADRVRDVMPPETLWIEITIEDDPRFRSLTFTTIDEPTAAAVDRLIEEIERDC